jgi:rhodanese-related sulfurtransferase
MRPGASIPIPVDRDEVQRLVADEAAQVVEVLPTAEFEDEHIAGAINIPLKELDERAPRLLDRGRPVIVYCYDYQ